MNGVVFQKSKAGTPQGGVISPLLANIALHGMGCGIKEALKMELFNYKKQIYGRASHMHSQHSITTIRYADDFVVIHESREIIEKAKSYIESWLKQIGLTLNEKKTEIVHTLKSIDGCNVGFKFLGFWVRQYYNRSVKRDYVTLIKPSKEGQKRHQKYIGEWIRKMRVETQETVIKKLNPIIRGWANYYRHQVSRKAFETADNHMFWQLWRWACWRHHNLGAKRIKRKYFREYKDSNWKFLTHDGVRLWLHGETHIVRHMKIHGTRTPFDGNLSYWNKRKSNKATNANNFGKSTIQRRCA